MMFNLRRARSTTQLPAKKKQSQKNNRAANKGNIDEKLLATSVDSLIFYGNVQKDENIFLVHKTQI